MTPRFFLKTVTSADLAELEAYFILDLKTELRNQKREMLMLKAKDGLR